MKYKYFWSTVLVFLLLTSFESRLKAQDGAQIEALAADYWARGFRYYEAQDFEQALLSSRWLHLGRLLRRPTMTSASSIQCLV